jgi:hypothetical protein
MPSYYYYYYYYNYYYYTLSPLFRAFTFIYLEQNHVSWEYNVAAIL